ncbi:MAG: UDP-N-acetylglucosamine diphosphorylase/glucosamine-1-phosphate N-acetyltransferase [Gammaproteobacteria bacterium]|nr:MAG: UDP-N-acetylglucosamine diphosphorylase/glucosamine-1-phosphate N-acetyltransferase [Gammaproteobacteria bacterium]
MDLHVVILAAGQGTRMKSSLPKVLHPVAGKPMVQHVVDTARTLSPASITVVYGHGGDQVCAALANADVPLVEQAEQLGTGHAVAQALPVLPETGRLLVLYGDVPLTRADTLKVFCEGTQGLGILTVHLENPTGYGRIVRDELDRITGIVEQKDATADQLQIREVNTGIMCMPIEALRRWIPQLGNQNAQGEYYLTDIVALAVQDGLPVTAAHPHHVWEVEGVNNRLQLAALERQYQQNQAERLMTDGVTVLDPARLDVRGDVEVGPDSVLDVNVVLEGTVRIGRNVTIGAGCVIRNSTIGDGVEIAPYSVLEDATVDGGNSIGPFARLRPGAHLHEGAKVGNFVEVKKAEIGPGSKVNHLTYIGDATIGANVNVGAGTITCNYDGVNKFRTVLEDDVFIGSNTALVAPVTVGKGATVGAGSVITKDVPEGELAVARGKQMTIRGWQRPVKQK